MNESSYDFIVGHNLDSAWMWSVACRASQNKLILTIRWYSRVPQSELSEKRIPSLDEKEALEIPSSLALLCLLPWFTLPHLMYRPRSLVSRTSEAGAIGLLICTDMGRGQQSCQLPARQIVPITPVFGPLLTISGSLSTTNIIMAKWSRAMWQSVVNRATRMLASGPHGSHFFSAIATVDGN
ncbi:hypothetical protein KIN20_010819 [Parelaphostrongylus tenuis]|uniref:Uncharacterized protein n=1 Tax=Parelaphostrongylus tenuis TaxID=148309 RepID=A0AAD5M8G1_PARTN|nr:hypothetical protein KIN20_010819 [Parelaphostrongylus tenuis]